MRFCIIEFGSIMVDVSCPSVRLSTCSFSLAIEFAVVQISRDSSLEPGDSAILTLAQNISSSPRYTNSMFLLLKSSIPAFIFLLFAY